jgi:hypothetical protein
MPLSKAARSGTTLLWRETQAASWLARGREWKYAMLSSRARRVSVPSMITWRSSVIHGNTSVANGLASISRPLRLS